MPIVPQLHRRSQRGFTLIEMIVVISIITIIAGLSFSAIFALRSSTPVKTSHNLIANLIRQAKHTSSSNNAPVELKLDSEKREIRGVANLTIFSQTFEKDP